MPPKKRKAPKRRRRQAGGGWLDDFTGGLVDGFTAPLKVAGGVLNKIGLKPSQLAGMHPATAAAAPWLSMLGQGGRGGGGGARIIKV